MRKVIVVSREGLVDTKRKLFTWPDPVGSGMKFRTFCATELMLGTLLPGKAVRHVTPPTVLVVDGSKICPKWTGEPSHGLVTGTPLLVSTGPKRAEKSPERSACVGTVVRLDVP